MPIPVGRPALQVRSHGGIRDALDRVDQRSGPLDFLWLYDDYVKEDVMGNIPAVTVAWLLFTAAWVPTQAPQMTPSALCDFASLVAPALTPAPDAPSSGHLPVIPPEPMPKTCTATQLCPQPGPGWGPSVECMGNTSCFVGSYYVTCDGVTTACPCYPGCGEPGCLCECLELQAYGPEANCARHECGCTP